MREAGVVDAARTGIIHSSSGKAYLFLLEPQVSGGMVAGAR
jgi:hypothetical protein